MMDIWEGAPRALDPSSAPPPSTRLPLGSNLVENQKSREREVEGRSSPFQTRPHSSEESRKMERALVNLLQRASAEWCLDQGRRHTH